MLALLPVEPANTFAPVTGCHDYMALCAASGMRPVVTGDPAWYPDLAATPLCVQYDCMPLVSSGIGDVGVTMQWIHDLTGWSEFVMQRWSAGNMASFNPADPAQVGPTHYSTAMSFALHPLCAMEHVE
jgi:hypothetical protein